MHVCCITCIIGGTPGADALRWSIDEHWQAFSSALFIASILLQICKSDLQCMMQAWNKRATAFYLAKDFESSIKDCQKTLELQPDHFLAMSGMGLCYAGLERWDDALHWFQQSVGIHPHMEQIQKYIDRLRAKGFGRDSSAA